MSEEVTPVRKAARTSLGRGLGSLLGENAAPEAVRSVTTPTANKSLQAETVLPTVGPATPPESRVWSLAIERIQPNPSQPRKHFDPQLLKELADSIKEKGIIQPILVRPIDGGKKYEIVAGERRWRASQQAGLKEVPAIIKGLETQEMLELAIIENIQRADLNPIEEAEAYSHLAKTYGHTQQELAQKVGKDRATIANLMRILQLHPAVREMVKKCELQLGQAKVLLTLEDQAQQLEAAQVAVKKSLTVRQLEKYIKWLKESAGAAVELDVYNEKEAIVQKMLNEVESELQKKFGTKVKIDQLKGKGQISVQFYSFTELNQIIERLRKA